MELSHIMAERPKTAEGKPARFDFAPLRAETRAAIAALSPGSFVFEVDDPAYPRSVLRSVSGGPLAMVAWKNGESFNMMVVRACPSR